jgi:hypothetical protein
MSISVAPTPEKDRFPSKLLAAIRAELRNEEQLVWVGRPSLKGHFKELLLFYPLFLVFGAATAAGAWLFFSWAEGAGVLGSFRVLLILVVIGVFGLSLLVVPLLWPLRLLRSWYALTTQRVILRAAQFLILWTQVRSLDPTRMGALHVRIWSYLPDRTGDITWAGGEPERVPHVEEVAELIRRTFRVSPNSGAHDAVPSVGSTGDRS